MEHISPQSLMAYSTHSSVSPDPMFPMGDLYMPQHQLSVTKQPKKRKSWGQELPEPKTNLPPRKRAKTEDEKEQRRIERIKRNRAAAHNSRERKRQEAEGLAHANDALIKKINDLQRSLAVKEAQLAKCKEQLGGNLPEVSGEEISSSYDRRYSELSASQSPYSSSTIDPRASLSCSTPATTPDTTPYIKMEDNLTSDQLHDPMNSEGSLFASLDPTQHSAAMLCDLQCRSDVANSQPSAVSTSPTWVSSATILFLMHSSVMSLYKTSLLALWTHSPATMNRQLTTLTRSSTLTRPRAPSTTACPTPLPPSWSTLAQHHLLATGPTFLGESALALQGEARPSSVEIQGQSRSEVSKSPSASGSGAMSIRKRNDKHCDVEQGSKNVHQGGSGNGRSGHDGGSSFVPL